MVVRRALSMSSLAKAEDRSLLRDSKAAAGQQGMTEYYHGVNGKRAPQVWTECWKMLVAREKIAYIIRLSNCYSNIVSGKNWDV